MFDHPTQVPTEHMTSTVLVTNEECVQDNSVRYYHHNIVTAGDQVPGDQDQSTRHRRGKETSDNDDNSDNTDKKVSSAKKDPLKWFGVLSPPSLRQSQVKFKHC